MSSVMMERSALGMPGVGPAGMPAVGPQAQTPGTNMLVVPRCTLKVERCDGGLKITCATDDKTAAAMVQNLCAMLAGGMCSCCVLMNGLTVCCCNLTMGLCRCEMTKNGVCVTCTSGDQKCCQMLQACCDCLSSLLAAGGTCCLMMNNMPVCCGSCEGTR